MKTQIVLETPDLSSHFNGIYCAFSSVEFIALFVQYFSENPLLYGVRMLSLLRRASNSKEKSIGGISITLRFLNLK